MLGYFGPEGTFTHQALLSLGLDEEALPFPSVAATLDAVRDGVVRAGLVPIENSIEGGVSATLDNLAVGLPLVITAEVLLHVQFGLYGRPGTELTDVRKVVTHPHAAAQVRSWLAAHVPSATVTERGSTAGAARDVAAEGSAFDAAVCARVAGEMYGLVPLASDIADNPDAVTRFILVGRPAAPAARTGHDKTSLVAYMREDRSGALLEILEQFASRGVNLCRIESRPTKERLGSYCFAIDAEGHLSDARMAEALMGLHRICNRVDFLGSYPRADKVEPTVEKGFREPDYAKAATWLAGLTR
ncbi:MAG: prephenate dehydratase [Propionibacteriaceae bacterium]